MVLDSLKSVISLIFQSVNKIIKQISAILSQDSVHGSAPQMPALSHAHMSDENGFPVSADHEILVSPREVVKKLLERDGRIVVGKLKRSFSDVEFLIENMNFLSEIGVRKLFCNFIDASDQDLLDRYHKGEVVGDGIKEYIKNKFRNRQGGLELSTRAELYQRLLRTARDAGIVALGIDTASGEIGTPDPNEAVRIIKAYDKKIPGKSIICVGAMEWASA